MRSIESVALPRRAAFARWYVAAGVAAALSAFALTACGPRDEARSAAGAAPVATQAPATVSTAATAPATATNDARSGAPVPPVQTPAAALAPAAAVAPPPPAIAPTVAAPPTGYAAAPAQGPVAAADDSPSRPVPQTMRTTRVAQAPLPGNRIGSIESIEPIRQRPQGTGAGAVLGGVLGGVVGNQFGHGLGRAAMTGLGAAGGAVAGNNIERNVRKTIVGYRVHVRLDNGSTRTFERSQLGNLHVGDRVRVDGNGLRRA